MKIKLTKPAGFLSSAKHVIIEVGEIVTIEDNGDAREVTLTGGRTFDVTESVDQIEKLLQPAAPTLPPTPAET